MGNNRSRSGPNPNKATVLVVEDEPAMAKLLERAFSKAGFQSLVARDGLQAIDLYRHHKHDIDVVLVDLGLPKTSGLEVIGAIRNQNSNAKIVVTTGYLDPEIETQLLASGVRHYIQKPYFLDEVIRAVESVLAHA